MTTKVATTVGVKNEGRQSLGAVFLSLKIHPCKGEERKRERERDGGGLRSID